MTEVLGEAVLDLTADLAPLARKLAEARAMTENSMRDMAQSGQILDRQMATSGTNIERSFSGPLAAMEGTNTRLGQMTAQMQAMERLRPFEGALNPSQVRQYSRGVEDLNARLESSVRAMHDINAMQLFTSDDQRVLTGYRNALGGVDGMLKETLVQMHDFDSTLTRIERRRSALDTLRSGIVPSQSSPWGSTGITHGDLQRAHWQPAVYASGLVGARGPANVGSAQNPIVTTLESGVLAGLGSRAAAIGAADAQGTGASAAAAIPVKAGGGGGSGGGPPIIITGGGGGGGGGDSGGIGGMATSAFLSKLFMGGGGRIPGFGRFGGFAAGAGAGSLLSFAGLDPLHLLTTLGAVGGSAAQGAVGAGLLGLGAVGQMAVGGGADALAFKTTMTNVQNLSKALDTLQQQQAIYGKNSRQAAIAQAQLNFQMQQAGPAAGAALAVAKQQSALADLWRTASAGAQTQSAQIMSQVLSLASSYVPRVAAAAKDNLSVINSSLRPLFTWLKGPQGIQIFNNLEYNFRKSLPTAMDAFRNGIEGILKLTSQASNLTGGFTHHLDSLMIKFNQWAGTGKSADFIGRMVGAFRQWEQLVKALGLDLYYLFRNDAGTGSSIVSTLTTMLQKLGAWEKSTRGSAQIHNIFQVHKEEVLALLHLMPLIFSSFGKFYLLVAPPLTAMLTTILKLVGGLFAALQHLGTAFADVAAGGLILAKLGILVPVLRAVSGALGFGGAAAGAGAAAAAGGTAAGAVGAGTSAVVAGTGTGTGLIMGGAAATETSAGFAATVAAGATAALPLLLAGGAAFLTYKAFDALFGPSLGRPDARATPQGTTGLAFPTRYGGSGRIGPGGIPSTHDQALDIQTVGKFSDYSATRLKELIVQMKQAGSLKLNGIATAKQGLIDMAEAALRAKTTFNTGFNQAWNAVRSFFRDTGRGLGSLKDDFNSNMRLIASTMSLDSKAGRDAVATNVAKMIDAVTHGMNTGKISVTSGMRAIQNALQQGMDAGAITWRTRWKDMFTTVTDLYQHHKIDTATYLRDLQRIQAEGNSNIRRDVHNQYAQTFLDLKHQYDNGLWTKQQYDAQVKKTQQDANKQQAADLAVWVGNLEATMNQSGGVTLTGMQTIAKTANQLLKSLGASPIPVPTLQQAAASQLGAAKSKQLIQRGASGGLMQVGRPGQVGPDSVPLNVNGTPIVVAPGEKLAVINRHQEPVLNRALAREGYDGGLLDFFERVKTPHHMARGGIVPGFAQGGYSGYSLPLPRSMMTAGNWSIDQGVDIPGGAGGEPEFAIGPGIITQEGIGGFGPNAPILKIDPGAGPLGGRSIYYGHAGPDTVRVGQHVRAGQQISEVGQGIVGISTGPHIEIGFWPSSGGAAMAAVLKQLLGGAGVTGVGGAGGIGASVPEMHAPGVRGHGAIATLARALFGKTTKAANAYIQSKVPNVAPGTAGVPSFGGKTWEIELQKIAKARGWSVADWNWIVNAESSGNPNVMNSIGAYGLGQFLPMNYGKYGPGSDPHQHPTAVQEIDSMAAYIAERYHNPTAAKAFHLIHNWYDQGGLVKGFAAGTPGARLRHHPPGWTPPRGKAPKKGKAVPRYLRPIKPSKPIRMPKVKAIPGFDESIINQLNKIDTVDLPDLSTWQSYVTGLHGQDPVVPIITMPDGTQVLNLDGMIDPATGQPTKGINQGLAEIGNPLNPGSWPDNKFTDLGIDYRFLELWGKEQSLAGEAAHDLIPWTDKHKTNLTRWQRTLRNLKAVVEYLTRRREQLAVEKAKRTAALTERFKRARAALQAKSATGTFNANTLLADQTHALAQERRIALAAIPTTPPASFLGDTTGWRLAHQLERAQITNEFDRRLQALQDTARAHKFEGQLSGLRARAGLSIEETEEKAALQVAFDNKRIVFNDRIRDDGRRITTASKQVTLEQGLLDAALGTPWGSGGTTAQLAAFLDPNGAMAVGNILTMKNITIPSAVRGYNALAGTNLTAATPGTQTDSQLVALLKAQAQTLAQNLAVSQAQYKVLANFPPFGGSFATGGVVPGFLGEPRTIIAHGGETITPPGSNDESRIRVMVEDHRVRVFYNDVEQVVNRNARLARREMPGQPGGLWNR